MFLDHSTTRISLINYNIGSFVYRKYGRFLVEVDGVHDDEDLLVLVSEAGVGLLEGSLAVVLDPAVFAQEGGGEAQRKTKLEWKTVNSRR